MLYLKDSQRFEPKKEDINDNKTFNNIDNKKYKILDNRKKSFGIFKKEEKKEQNNSSFLRTSKRKKTFTDEDALTKINQEAKNDSFAILGKINFVSIKIHLSNNEQITCDGECQFCKFIQEKDSDYTTI